MDPAPLAPNDPPSDERPPLGEAERALLVSLPFAEHETAEHMGQEAYSYHFVYRAFRPLLQRLGWVREVTQAESRLDYAIWQAAQQRRVPLHLSFLPLHGTYPTQRAPNIAFPFWEFPDIPNHNICNNSRYNWVRTAERLALVVTACTFTREAFRRASVTTPIKVVPVPIRDDYFATADWQREQRVVLNCPSYVFPQQAAPRPSAFNPWVKPTPGKMGLRARLQYVYQNTLKPRLPEHLRTSLNLIRRATETAMQVPPQQIHVLHTPSPTLELSGIVYTSILNPFDPRKNWQDLLSAFLLALGDRADATLVVKIVTPPKYTALALNGLLGHFQELGLRHRCRVAFVPGYLSDEQMAELLRATTYYVNTARAEGACLPLQSFLAAGRPAIAPLHTALVDYFHEGLGFVVASHAEPTAWPHDPSRRRTTTWHRLVWESLHDEFRASYEVATRTPRHYRELAARGREQMAAYASAEEVWPRLADALASVSPTKQHATALPVSKPALVRVAS